MALTTKIFLDTSFFKAFIDQKDDFHTQSKLVFAKFQDNSELLTTNFILDETFTLVRVKCGKEVAKDLYNILSASFQKLKIIRVLAIDERKSWEWFWKDWSKLSFTDCTSFAVMKRLGLTKVATFDDHFKKAGFKILQS